MSAKPVRLAVAGLGMASKPHLEALADLRSSVEVSGLFDISKDRAEERAKAYGFPVFDSFDAIVADPETDGVIVITPPDQRQDIVSRLAGAGKHILSEKPVERTTANAEKIVDICEAHNVTLGIVFQHRFRAGAERLRALIEAGELGDLSLVRADIPWWRDQSYYDAPGRGTYQRDGGGVLISQAIHIMDLMLSLTAPVIAVQALCATTRAHKMESEDFATAGITFADGAFGSIIATTATYPGGAEGLIIDGTKATAELRAGKLNITWRDGRTESVGELSGTGGGADPMAFPSDWHRDLIKDFADAIASGRSPRISGREALKVHRFIDALVTSSKTGLLVPLT